MRIRATFLAIAATIVSAALLQSPLAAQGPGGFSPALFNQSGPLVDAHGSPAVIPASFGPGGYGCPTSGCQGYGPAACAPNSYNGGYGGPTACEPYCSGALCEQCGPHYFDLSFDYLMYYRDSYGGGSTPLATLNVLPGGDVVLSTDQITGDMEPGFRITGRFDLTGLSVLEVSYSGLIDMGGSASFSDPAPVSDTVGNLFSPFTDFGQDPVLAVPPAAGEDFAETDNAVSAAAAFDSSLHTAEISVRRYWVGHSPRVSGTWLWGFRYTSLEDEFLHRTVGRGTYLNHIKAKNQLMGFQFGGDGWFCVLQGLRVGMEGKAGIYGNQVDITNEDSINPTLPSTFSDTQAAFIGETRLMMVADITPCFSFKTGYEVLYMSSVATALGNFTTASPYDVTADSLRSTSFAAQSDALFHGFQASLEYVW